MKRTVLFLALFLLYPGMLFADSYVDIFKIQCIPELGLIEIRQTTAQGKKAEIAFQSNSKGLYEKYGYVVVESLIKRDKKGYMQAQEDFEMECIIGEKKYEITLSPFLENPSIEGRCGGFISARLSVQTTEEPFIDNLLFQTCDEVLVQTPVEIFIDEGYARYNGKAHFF